jgi:hypothetical protein
MITPAEEDFIKNFAYVPEHMPGYGTAVSGGETFLLDNYTCYHAKEFLVFIGYPLQDSFDESKMGKVLDKAIERFNPARVALIAPSFSRRDGEQGDADAYYKLDLAALKVHSKVKNMIRKASRELEVEKGREFKSEHRQLVADFLESRRVSDGTRTIFEKIQEYLTSVPTASIFSARGRSGRLAGFDIAEFGSREYAFYMFNFRSSRDPLPGTSDLLLYELIQEAKHQGKRFLNLGLGVNAGVTYFKRKWGGQPFLNHEFVLFGPRRTSPFEAWLQGFLGR